MVVVWCPLGGFFVCRLWLLFSRCRFRCGWLWMVVDRCGSLWIRCIFSCKRRQIKLWGQDVSDPTAQNVILGRKRGALRPCVRKAMMQLGVEIDWLTTEGGEDE